VFEYLSWLFKFEYLILPTGSSLVFYVSSAISAIIFRWIIFLRFLYLPLIEHYKKMEELHGRPRKSSLFSYLKFFILGVIWGPVSEEILFRGPILYFLVNNSLGYALIFIPLTSLIFGAIHYGQSGQVTYRDGIRDSYSKISVTSCIIGGFVYGFLTLLSYSLWPAIFTHILWNISAGMMAFGFVDKNKLDKFAQAMQR